MRLLPDLVFFLDIESSFVTGVDESVGGEIRLDWGALIS